MSLTIVNGTVLQQQLFLADVGRVANNTIEGAMYVGINQLVFVGLFVEVHTLPLTTHAIVWEIVEHTVNTVAAQGDIVFGGAFSEQRSIDVQACIAMEIDGGALADGQRSSFGNSQTAIDNKWLLCRDGGVITYDGVTKNRRIP